MQEGNGAKRLILKWVEKNITSEDAEKEILEAIAIITSLKDSKYDAYYNEADNLIRSAQVFYNEKKNYMLMLSRDKLGVE